MTTASSTRHKKDGGITIAAPEGFPAGDWLEAIDEHPKLGIQELQFGYCVTGLITSEGLAEKQELDSWLRLVGRGFLKCVELTEEGVYVYEPLLPGGGR